MHVAHVEPRPRDRPRGQHAVGGEPGAPASVLLSRHFPVPAAFEEEDGPVRVGVVGRVQVSDRVALRLCGREDVDHLLRVGPEDSIPVDVECEHLPSKDSKTGSSGDTDLRFIPELSGREIVNFPCEGGSAT